MNVEALGFLPPNRAERPYTVSEINDGIARIIDSAQPLVWVEGEISTWRVSSNGHCYFRLKDPQSQIPAVLWNTIAGKLTFEPEDGLAVLVIATVRVYRKAGYYQLDVHRMEPQGKGALFLAFEQLKKRLEAEGLFDPSHKVPLPPSIGRLGVITSKQGAAIRDIVRVASMRAPQTDIVLIDVPVQGETAAPRIAAGIRDMNAWGGVDCIIVGRGGGSAEDLWPFNEEAVARAIYESEIADVSAVGHETDYTIADFVADMRAPTPSAAVEIALPDRAESRRYLDACQSRFSVAVVRPFAEAGERFASCVASRSFQLPARLLLECRQQRDGAVESLLRGFAGTLTTAASRFSSAASRLSALSPLGVLARGFSIVTVDGTTPVCSSDQVDVGQRVSMRFSKGAATATVDTVDPPAPLL